MPDKLDRAARKWRRVEDANAVVERAREGGAFDEFEPEIDRPETADALAERVRDLLGPLGRDLWVLVVFYERYPSLSAAPTGPWAEPPRIRQVTIHDRHNLDLYLESLRRYSKPASEMAHWRPLGRGR